MKAMVLARRFLKENGLDVICYPELVDLDFDGRTVTAIKLIVEPRQFFSCIIFPLYPYLRGSNEQRRNKQPNHKSFF